MIHRTSWMMLGILIAGAAFVQGQTTSAPSNDQTSLVDRAIDDATQNLFDTVGTMRVVVDGATYSIAGLLSASPQTELQLRQAIIAHRQIGQTRTLSPGSLSVDVFVDGSQIQEALQSIYKSENPAAPKKIQASGTTTLALLATGWAVEDAVPRDKHPGWRHCKPETITLCRKAAERDLRQRLLAWLMRIPLANGATVSQLTRQDTRIDRSLRSQLDRIKGSEFNFEPTGICILSCTVSAEQLMTLIRVAFAAGDLSPADELRPAVAFESTTTFQGFSLAPRQSPPRPVTSKMRTRPAWAEKTLIKTASATAPSENIDPIARKELAIQAARIECERQIWIELELLIMPDGRTLGDHLVERTDRAQLASAINKAIQTLSRPEADNNGKAIVSLGVHLETVWQIVGQ